MPTKPYFRVLANKVMTISYRPLDKGVSVAHHLSFHHASRGYR